MLHTFKSSTLWIFFIKFQMYICRVHLIYIFTRSFFSDVRITFTETNSEDTEKEDIYSRWYIQYIYWGLHMFEKAVAPNVFLHLYSTLYIYMNRIE